jgi:hypothetical protein
VEQDSLVGSFSDELQKIAVSRSRAKRRPYRVSTLLDKESAGTGWTGKNKKIFKRGQQ